MNKHRLVTKASERRLNGFRTEKPERNAKKPRAATIHPRKIIVLKIVTSKDRRNTLPHQPRSVSSGATAAINRAAPLPFTKNASTVSTTLSGTSKIPDSITILALGLIPGIRPASPEKVIEVAEHGGAVLNLEGRQAL